jgi:hypothetical protein
MARGARFFGVVIFFGSGRAAFLTTALDTFFTAFFADFRAGATLFLACLAPRAGRFATALRAAFFFAPAAFFVVVLPLAASGLRFRAFVFLPGFFTARFCAMFSSFE